MEFLYFVLAGLLGGVLGGMGMGGGTVLIPLLNIFYSVGQHNAQAINLVSFIPMAVVALIIHIKNKLVEFKDVIFIILSGLLTCVIGCVIAQQITGEILKKIFGGFLILLSIFQAIFTFLGKTE